MIHVCICTHNPRADIFDKVLRSIAAQTCGPAAFELLIIDNASDPPLTAARCGAILGQQISFRIEREPKLGNAYARARAAGMTHGPWLLFVDDDNELDLDYIRNGIDIIDHFPDLGCFGGRLILPDNLRPANWVQPLLGYLAIKEGGEAPITQKTDEWGVWYPPTAGAFVRRPLLDRYLEIMASNPLASQLGRKGRQRLTSGEDSLIMLAAHPLGYSASYQPSLRLYHHLARERFKFRYLSRLMYSYGKSHVILERVRGLIPPRYTEKKNFFKIIAWVLSNFTKDCRTSIRYSACMIAFRIGYAREKWT